MHLVRVTRHPQPSFPPLPYIYRGSASHLACDLAEPEMTRPKTDLQLLTSRRKAWRIIRQNDACTCARPILPSHSFSLSQCNRGRDAAGMAHLILRSPVAVDATEVRLLLSVWDPAWYVLVPNRHSIPTGLVGDCLTFNEYLRMYKRLRYE